MTTPQIALHEIRLGKPKRNGEADIVAPGKMFDCPDDELEFLQSAKACRDLTDDEAERLKPSKKKAAKTEKEDDPDEAKRLALIEEAKGMGVKGIRKDMTLETVQEKIDEHKAAEGDGEDEDVVG